MFRLTGGKHRTDVNVTMCAITPLLALQRWRAVWSETAWFSVYEQFVDKQKAA